MIEPRVHLKTLERKANNEPSRMFKYRLDRNERNQPFSGAFIKNIKEKISGELFMVYPELVPLYDKLASWLNINTKQLMLHSGAAEAIKAVFETYINPGDQVLLHFPGYVMYEVYCKMFQAQAVSQYFDSGLFFDWDAYIEKLTKNIRMVVVENPNGFLGTVISLKQLEVLIDKAYKLGIIVLVDEAYFHFHEETVQDRIEKYDNLIICRTFSKAFGIGGLRAGYLISQSVNVDYLMRSRPVYEINSMAALLILELLDHIDEFSSYVIETRSNLMALRRGLSELGIQTSDSKANFVAAKLGNQIIHDELRKRLGEQNILIRRPFREDNLKDWVRISTAPPKIQAILLDELYKILSKEKNKNGEKNACL